MKYKAIIDLLIIASIWSYLNELNLKTDVPLMYAESN